MKISAELQEQVRQRANFSCEYCGVTDIDAGGQLTVDHFQPQSRGGTDDPGNLLYCCFRCNLYKADYWPMQPSDPALWNPRQQPIENHLLALEDGSLYPITSTGAFTLNRLRLNRSHLLAYRLGKQRQAEELRFLARYRAVLASLEELHRQQESLLVEQRALLEEQRALLWLLKKREE